MERGEKEGLPPLVYVALGDSLTLGIGAWVSPGFVSRYKRLAEQELKRHIEALVFARRRANTAEILHMFGHDIVKNSVRQANLITITAGGNDLLRASRAYKRSPDKALLENALGTAITNVQTMLYTIKTVKRSADTPYIVRIINLYNPYPQDKLAVTWVRKFNAKLKAVCKKNSMTKVVDMHAAFLGREKKLLSIDRLHPNRKGYRVMAEQLHDLGYASLPSFRVDHSMPR
jgi:lysophospholipase L1-like esterase